MCLVDLGFWGPVSENDVLSVLKCEKLFWISEETGQINTYKSTKCYWTQK